MLRQGSKIMLLENSVEAGFRDIEEESENSIEEIKLDEVQRNSMKTSNDEVNSKKSKLMKQHILTFKNPMMDLRQEKDRVSHALHL